MEPRSSPMRRLGALVQAIAAVMVVGALLAGFLLLFASHHTKVDGSGPDISHGTWRVVNSPHPGSVQNGLRGVAALSANNVWAVGSASNTPGGVKSRTLIEHWNGVQWNVVESPDPGPTECNLFAVSAISANDIWAVGSFSNSSSGGRQPFIEHWDGTKWSVSQNPASSQGSFYAVMALSANDVWVVGMSLGDGVVRTLIEHWNGNQWSIVNSPNMGGIQNILTGVAAISPHDVWAVGWSASNGQSVVRTLTEHWNGRQWSIVNSPNASEPQNWIYGVTAISARDVWVVGLSSNSSTGAARALIEHWNGAQWSIVRSPNPPSSGNVPVLLQVTAASSNNIWAVGYLSGRNQGVERTLIEHWNGDQWSIVKSPNSDPGWNELWSVAAVPGSNSVWAVGNDGPLVEPSASTLTELYS